MNGLISVWLTYWRLRLQVARQHSPGISSPAAACKATYRFFSNHRITVEHLDEAVAAATVEQCRGHSTVLVVHDTTSLNYSAITGTQGLGPVGSAGHAQGLYLHSTLALRSDGVALGLLHQECWSRSRSERGAVIIRPLPIEEKESRKWLVGIGGGDSCFGRAAKTERPRVIHLMDRESDIHEVLEAIADSTDGCVIRCKYNRMHRGSDRTSS